MRRQIDVRFGDTELGLRPAQTKIVLREFCLGRNGNRAAVFHGRGFLRIGRLDTASHATKQIELPGGGEAILKNIDLWLTARPRNNETKWIADRAVSRAIVGGCRREVRQTIGADHIALRPRFLDTRGRLLYVEVLLG